MAPMRTTIIFALLLVTSCVLSAADCAARAIDVPNSLQVTDVVTGWFDAGIVGGKNKLVPSMSFRLKNVSAEDIKGVQVMLSFRLVNEMDKEWGSAYAKAIDERGLKAGEATDALVLRCAMGYTGEQARIDMLRHRQFVDAKVQMFLKHGAQPWVPMGERVVARQLLTR